MRKGRGMADEAAHQCNGKNATHGYCPACRVDSAIDRAGNCLWCDTPTEPSRPDLPLVECRYTAAQLRVLRLIYQREEVGLVALAAKTFERVGYKNATDAAEAIRREWRRMGLSDGWQPGFARKSETRLCRGIRSKNPRIGQPCQLPPSRDSDYCRGHDPAKKEERALTTLQAKEARRHQAWVLLAPFSEWLQGRYAELGSWAAVAKRIDRHVSTTYRYSFGLHSKTGAKKELARRKEIEAMLSADGTTTFGELYPAADSQRLVEVA